jgi:hypothetical protein
VRIGEEGGDDELALWERVDGAEVDRTAPLAEQRRQEGKSGDRQRDPEGDDPAEGERRSLEQAAARVALFVALWLSCRRGDLRAGRGPGG